MASTVFEVPTALEGALGSLGFLETLTDAVTLVGASLNQEVEEDGSLTDVIDIYWSLPGRPGTMTSRVQFDPNWTAQAFFRIGVKQALVRGIYAGLASKDELPSLPPGPPLPGVGVAVPV